MLLLRNRTLIPRYPSKPWYATTVPSKVDRAEIRMNQRSTRHTLREVIMNHHKAEALVFESNEHHGNPCFFVY